MKYPLEGHSGHCAKILRAEVEVRNPNSVLCTCSYETWSRNRSCAGERSPLGTVSTPEAEVGVSSHGTVSR